jgi:hypothetical protein
LLYLAQPAPEQFFEQPEVIEDVIEDVIEAEVNTGEVVDFTGSLEEFWGS